MAKALKNELPSDPDVIAAQRRRDRALVAFDDGIVGIEAVEAADPGYTRALADLDRRTERAEVLTCERARIEAEADERAQRWKAAGPEVAQRMTDREVACMRCEQAFAEVIESVAAWNACLPLSPVLVDAAPVIANRRDVDPLPYAFREAMRPVAAVGPRLHGAFTSGVS